MNSPSRILVFCLPGIGDTLLATPMFHAVKKSLPEARITAVTMFKGARDVLKQDPNVDEVLHFSFMNEGVLRSLKFVLGLRKRRFDASILAYPSNRLEYNAVSFLVGARRRFGHRYNHMDLLCGNWLNAQTVKEDNALTNIEENLRLVTLLTGETSRDHRVRLHLMPEHKEFAKAWLSEHKLSDRTLIGIHAGGSTAKNHMNKRWPAECYAELAKGLVAKTDASLLLFGGPEEQDTKQVIAAGAGMRAVDVETGDFLQTSALIERCSHFVANDTALLHAAGVLGVPTTAIFGPTCREWVRIPEAPRTEMTRDLECQPCFYYSPRHLRCSEGDFRCIKNLPLKRVLEEIISQLNTAEVPSPKMAVAETRN